ncbi:MAG TPA: hypothetical protein VHZ26_05040 [Caulobacteraceae bacterium]|jgi:hypothetical protein|nr:hypothetical protein [Caulobacteraceae bacterium]
MPSARVTRRQRTLGAVSSAAFHILILIGLAFELDKPINVVEQPPIQVTLAPPLEEPPPKPIPIIPPRPTPAPVKKLEPEKPTPVVPPKPVQAQVQPAQPAKPQQAPLQPAPAAAAPTPVTTPAPQKAPTVRVKSPTPVAHAAPAAAPTPIAHATPSLVQSPLAPVLLPPAPQASATSQAPSASSISSAPSAAAAAAAAGSNGLRNALRLGFGCAHPDAVSLTAAERATCNRAAAARGGPGFTVQPPDYILREGRANEARREYTTTNSDQNYPGLRCAAGRDCEPAKPTPSPDPINDTCPYLRCNMGSVR